MDFNEDPLASVPGDAGADHPGAFTGIPGFRMTNHGLRQLLGKKKVRGKPLVQLQCCGCGVTTLSTCRFIDEDWIESFPQSLVLLWQC